MRKLCNRADFEPCDFLPQLTTGDVGANTGVRPGNGDTDTDSFAEGPEETVLYYIRNFYVPFEQKS